MYLLGRWIPKTEVQETGMNFRYVQQQTQFRVKLKTSLHVLNTLYYTLMLMTVHFY